MDRTLSFAIDFATRYHAGAVRKGSGVPFITHPLAVADMVDHPVAKIIAVLHDTVEDTDATLEILTAYGFSPEVVAGVDALTKRKGETYMEFIARSAVAGQLVWAVKVADIRHNMTTSECLPEGPSMRKKYLKALAYLGATP